MKLERFILLTLCFLFSFCGGYSQDSLKRSTLSLSIGLNNFQNKDEFQSPYTYSGNNVLFNSVYEKRKTRRYHVLEFSYSMGNINSIVSPDANSILTSLSYDYFFNLSQNFNDKKFTFAIGPGLHTLANRVNYLPDVDLSKNYLLAMASLTIGGDFSYRLNSRSWLRAKVLLPVYGIVYRPDFEISGKTLVEGTSLANSVFISAKLEYVYELNSKLSFKASYSYNYFKFDHPRPINILQNGISIGIVIRF